MGIHIKPARRQAADTAATSFGHSPADGSPENIPFYQAQAKDTLHQFEFSLSQGEGNA